MDYTLRPAEPTDYEFIYQLKKITLQPYVAAAWGWDEAYQRSRFDQFFDPAKNQIVVFNEQDTGLLSVRYADSDINLDGIYILPKFQRRGLGTAIIKGLINEGKLAGLPINLQVLRVNPACQLYKRLGFIVTGETQTHYLMAFFT